MKALFLIGVVAKRPRPVQERPIRKALLRAISGMYDDSRPCNHIGAGARLISQPSPPGAHVLSGRLGHRLKASSMISALLPENRNRSPLSAFAGAEAP